jgi:hypothetical protein
MNYIKNKDFSWDNFARKMDKKLEEIYKEYV